MRYLSLILLFFTNNIIFSQGTLINSYTNTDINTVVLKDGAIFALGNQYLISIDLNTDQITFLNCPSTNFYTYSLNFDTDNNLYLISADHYPHYEYLIFRSEDMGNNWDTVFYTNNSKLFDLEINELDKMMAVGQNTFISSSDGVNWDENQVNWNNFIWVVESNKDSTFHLAGERCIVQTKDFGENWIFSPLYYENISSISLINDSISYYTSYSYNPWKSFFIKTNDSGLTYSIDTLRTNIGIYNSAFLNSDLGILIGYDYYKNKGLIMITSNGGQDWTEKAVDSDSKLYDIEIVNDSLVYIVGSNGVILKLTIESLFGQNSISSTNKNNKSFVFPNPSHDYLFIYGLDDAIKSHKVFDCSGREYNASIDRSQKSIHLSNLTCGSYYLELHTFSGNSYLYYFIKI